MVKMKRKTQKHQTKKNIKFNNALHTSRCTAVQDKTSLRHTFFNGAKFVCPKMKWEYDKLTKKSKRVCHCEDPCTESSCGRMFLSLSRKNCVLIQEHCVVHRNGMPIQNPCEYRKINQLFQGQLLCCRTQNPE